MSQLPLTRARLTRRSATAAFALCAVMLVAPAVSDSAVTRKSATDGALAALGSRDGNAPVIVFRLGKRISSGARVTERGAGKRTVARIRGERAFFFYEDSGPFRAYPHAGRVALVGARSGKVKLSRTLSQAPLLNGRLPRFLASPSRYASSRNRVFSRLPSTPAPVLPAAPFAADPFTPLASNQPPKADSQDAVVKQGAPKHIRLTATDLDGDMLLFVVTFPPRHGTLTGVPPDLVYTPNPGYLGNDKFAFKATDGEATSETAHVSLNVVPLGSPPVVATSTGCTAYSEQTPAVVVDGLVSVSDPDDTTLDSARVRISTNLDEGDALVFTDQNGISASFDDDAGVLQLTGTATLANYQTALRSIRYRNLSNGSPSATKDVEFSVNDAGNDSAPVTKQICISQGDSGTDNNRPIGEASEGALNYTENDGPVPIDPDFVAFDVDSATLSGATVKFSPTAASEDDDIGGGGGDAVFNFFPAEDALAFQDQNGITGSYDSETGVLTLSGEASVADYQTAIRSITYENSSENPSAEPRTIRYQITDSSGASSKPSTRSVLVTPVNDAPVVLTSEGSLSYTGTGHADAIDPALTVGDVDDTNLESARVSIASGLEAGDELVFSGQSGISGSYDGGTGILTLTGTASTADYETALRSIQYQNTAGNPAASKTVEFVVNDGDLDSGPGVKGIETNDQPVVDTTDTALAYTEGDGAVALDPGVTVSDADSPTLASATVQLTADDQSLAEDQIAFTDQNGITGFRDEETGLFILSGTATVADYQAALRSITYENASDTPSATTRKVVFHVDDGASSNSQSEAASRDLEVTPVNDVPVVTTSDGSSSYTVGGSATTVDSGVTVTDADDTDLESAKVRISDGFEAGDTLGFVDQLGITGAYDADTGVLTLTGTAPVADYVTALRSIDYSSSAGPVTTPKTVEFVVNDGDDDSSAALKTLDILPNNQ